MDLRAVPDGDRQPQWLAILRYRAGCRRSASCRPIPDSSWQRGTRPRSRSEERA